MKSERGGAISNTGAEQKTTSAETEQAIYEKLKARGAKSLDAYTMASANVSKNDAKKMAEDLAMDAIEKWQQTEDAKLGNGITAIPGKIANSIKRGFKLHEFNKNEQSKIEEKLSGEAALAERVAEAHKAGADNEDMGIKNLTESEKISFSEVRNKKISDLTAGEKVYRMVGKFAEKVAKSEGENDQRLDVEKAKILKNIRELNRNGAVKADNYAEVLNQMQQDLKGSLAKELVENRQKANVAVKALDRYLQENFTIVSADVEVGLAAKHAYSSLQDKNILKYGALVGSAIGLGSAVISGISQNKIISTIFGAAPAAAVARVAVAGAIGGAVGLKTKENAQIRDNIRDALGLQQASAEPTKTNAEIAATIEQKIKTSKQAKEDFDLLEAARKAIGLEQKAPTEKAESNAEKAKNRFEILSVDKMIAEMNALMSGDGKLKDARNFSKAAELIAELKARNTLQNQQHIQLLGFNGRENVEKSKMEMFKTMNRLKAAMTNSFEWGNQEKTANLIEAKLEQKLKGGKGEIGLSEQIDQTMSLQKKERIDAAIKSAAIAAGTTAMFEVVRNWKGIREAMGFKEEKVVSPETLKKYGNKPLMIAENQNHEVEAFGFDMNNDGVLNAEKGDVILRGKGFNLTNEQEFYNLRAELRENYHIDLERQAILNNKYGQVSVGSYVEKAKNAIEQDINKVNWSKSGTKVALSNPFKVGADGGNYQVSVWGVNGGAVPEGAKLYIDLDGHGPGKALEFAIKDGKAMIPADIVDVKATGNGGMANFIGLARVGEIKNGEMLSYAGVMGKEINLNDKIVAQVAEKGYSFTAWNLNETGDRISKMSQFAVNEKNQAISNLSEIFNGVAHGRSDNLPMTFLSSENGGEALTLKSGTTIPKHTILGGYHEEFDSFKNTAFYDNSNSSYLGTALKFDVVDGALDANNEASVVKQMFVRTATNPYTLGQNASNYGILEPNTLAEKIFKGNKILMENNLKAWGIVDGVIDSERELDLFMNAMKQNPIYWDRLANETLNEMEKQLANGGIEVARVTDRVATYANKGVFDTGRATAESTVFYPYKIENGQKVYVGNKGWWVKKWQGMEGGKVGDVAVSNQKCIATKAVPQATSRPAAQVVSQPPVAKPAVEAAAYRAKPTASPIINTLAREEVGPGVGLPVEPKPPVSPVVYAGRAAEASPSIMNAGAEVELKAPYYNVFEEFLN